MWFQNIGKHFLLLREWNDLPDFMRVPEVLPYYKILEQKRGSLVIKRLFDICMAGILLIVLLVPMVVIGVLIKLDSKGPVFIDRRELLPMGNDFGFINFARWWIMLTRWAVL